MIIGITGPGGCGGTFLDWTIQYLSGNNVHWHINLSHAKDKILEASEKIITDAPLIKSTAHAHNKTHPDNKLLNNIIVSFQKKSEYNLHSFYYVDSMRQDQPETTINKIIDDYPDVFFIDYEFCEKDLGTIFYLQYEKVLTARINYQFAISKKLNCKFDVIEVWDQREQLSIYYPNSVRGQTLNEVKNIRPNKLPLAFTDMICNLDKKIYDIFKYLNKEIDKSRLEHWKKTYKTWQELSGINFYHDLDYIIDSITDNKDVDLSQYNITFAREVVISSLLLYKHNLSLKSYGVVTMPDNTRGWHSMLEKNVYHDLSLT